MIINRDILHIWKRQAIEEGENSLRSRYKSIQDASYEKNLVETGVLNSFDYAEITYYENNSEYCAAYDIFLIDLTNHYPLKTPPITIFFELVPSNIINKVKNKEILLGLYSPYEPRSGYAFFDLIYEKMIIEYGIPESQILFIGGTYDYKDYILKLSDRLNKKPIKLEYYDRCGLLPKICIDRHYPNCVITSALAKKITKKKFVFLNNVSRPHRTSLLCLLNNKNLLKDSYTSFLNCSPDNWDDALNLAKKSFPEIEDKLNTNIKDNLPLKLDVDYKKDVKNSAYFLMPFSIQLLKYYYQAYFSLVTETVYQNLYPRFFTEKIHKCIAYKHPFVLATCYNSLERLRFLGFKTFHPYINEDYDLEPNDSKRLLLIADEVERLCNLSESELELFKEKTYEIVEYNYNHLMTAKLLFKLL